MPADCSRSLIRAKVQVKTRMSKNRNINVSLPCKSFYGTLPAYAGCRVVLRALDKDWTLPLLPLLEKQVKYFVLCLPISSLSLQNVNVLLGEE